MIYLDYAAATPLSDSARQAMEPYFAEKFFNPSAAYLPAVELRHEYQAAKDRLAHVIGAKGTDLVITGGATESINLAFQAVLPFQESRNYVGNSRRATDANNNEEYKDVPNILISAVEHDSVRAAATRAAQRSNGILQIIAVDKNGRVKIDDLKTKLTEKTQLISVCLACSELGTIQPIAEIAQLVRVERQRRLRMGIHTPIYLHCDASQGLGLLEVKVSRLGVDMLTLNSGKIYGPKGIGALFVGHQVKTLKPLIVGGGQEIGLRSGTENVAGLMGFVQAVVDAQAHIVKNRKKMQRLNQILREELSNNSIIPQNSENSNNDLDFTPVTDDSSMDQYETKNPIPIPKFLGNSKHQLANFCPLTYPGLDAERLIFLLEAEGVYVSTGTACAANSRTKSKTLQAIGLTDAEIAGSLRLSFGNLNNENNIRQAAQIIKRVIVAERQRLQKLNH